MTPPLLDACADDIIEDVQEECGKGGKVLHAKYCGKDQAAAWTGARGSEVKVRGQPSSNPILPQEGRKKKHVGPAEATLCPVISEVRGNRMRGMRGDSMPLVSDSIGVSTVFLVFT